MASYAQLGGVHTWYEERGKGDPLALLHPGMTDARAYGPNIGALEGQFRVFTPERRGHGHTPDVEGPFTYGLVVDDTISFIEQVIDAPVHLVGCSDGASIAILVARLRPDLVRRLVFIAGVYHRDGWVPGADEHAELPPEFMAASYGEVSPDGRDHFAVINRKMADMHAAGPTLTDSDLAQVESRTLVMVADDDEVTLEHAISAYRAIPDSELAIIPGTSHGLLVEKADLCNSLILDFLSTDPVPTIAPIERAASDL